MKEKYRVVILYTYYDNYINVIKAEEMKGNIEVVCVGSDKPRWKTVDGWPMTDMLTALLSQWDFLIYAGAKENFMEVSLMLQSMPSVTYDKVLPVNVFAIPYFDFRGYVSLNEKRISIISNHCWGGFTYHYLHMQFNSPFINMFVNEDEYLKLLENLEYYMGLEVENAGEGYETIQKRNYPIGRIGDVHLHFNHAFSFEEAVQKWEKRKRRLNMDSLFIHMSTSLRENAERFDLLPYKNKVVFVPKSYGLDSEISIEDIYDLNSDDIGLAVNRLASGDLRYYDVIKFLNGEKDFRIYNN